MYWYYKYILVAVALIGIGLGVYKLLPDDIFDSTSSTEEIDEQGKQTTLPVESSPELSKPLNTNKPQTSVKNHTPATVMPNAKPISSPQFEEKLKQGVELKNKGMLDSAYNILVEALEYCETYSAQWIQTATLISEINTYIYENAVPSKRKQSHKVKNGQSLWDFAAENTTIRAIQISNKIPIDSSVIHVNQVLTFFGGDWEIKASKSHFALQLLLDGKLFHYYKIGIGKDNRTPVGEFIIKGKKREPTWKGYPFGHPENVLGTRWMRLTKISDGSNEGYGIHGTSAPESIGTASSLGCIRMKNEDVEELFNFIPDNKIKVTIED
ncbi:L,D-transpeptidase family protein [Lentisphaera marina]|uniref:L,D-transpeptidase family protein n=1 Tax=Lentisphaera marina TaxID=1111041 RepID=UPI002366BC0C|nr:L,D-transpeptidase family protein [Lentisphaera marina]MDD7986709.1 L,D-transpeptidase family protein [Lentisphaera marina]